LEHPVNVSNIDTTGHNIGANQQSSSFKVSELVKDFESGRFQFPMNAHYSNRRQKAEGKKTKKKQQRD
jgi:hypothetical protein